MTAVLNVESTRVISVTFTDSKQTLLSGLSPCCREGSKKGPGPVTHLYRETDTLAPCLTFIHFTLCNQLLVSRAISEVSYLFQEWAQVSQRLLIQKTLQR